MIRFTSALLTLWLTAGAVMDDRAAPVPPSRPQVGSEITHDCGYYPKLPELGGVWVPIPKRLVLIGMEDEVTVEICRRKYPLLVYVEKGDRPPYDGFWVIDPGFKLTHLPRVSPNVGTQWDR